MTENLADAYPCPACRTPADLDRGCPGCGRPPDPDAAEVIRLDREIAALVAQEQARREAHAAVVAALAGTRQRRDAIASRVRASVAAASIASPAVPAPLLAPPVPLAGPAVPESSAAGIQTLLFVIGGLLLGTGAVVFTVVAWTTFGVVGQAAILAVGTGLALAVPVVALRRRLRGTAETFAVIGLLLMLLDGYAAWRAGLVGSLPGSTWAALVAGGTALLALPYRRWTGLAGPRFAVLLLAQPVLPLLAAEPLRHLPSVAFALAGTGYLAAVLAAGNLLARGWVAGGSAAPAGGEAGRWLRGLSWVAVGGWLATAGLVAVAGLAVADGPGAAAVAGGALVAGAAAFAGLAWVADRTGWPAAGWWASAAAAGTVLALALAGGRVAVLAWPELALLAVALVVAVAVAVSLLAGAGVLAGRAGLAAAVRRGARLGGLVATGAVGGFAAVLAAWGGLVVAGSALSRIGDSDPGGLIPELPYGWQVPVALALLGAGLAALAPAARAETGAVTVALVALAAPAAWTLPWWAPVPVDLLVAAGLAVAAAAAGTGRRVVTGAVLAAGLAGHALLAGAVTAAGLAAGLGSLVLLGPLVAMLAAVRAARTGEAGGSGGRGDPARPVRLAVGRAALLTGLLAWPPAVAAALAAAGLAAPGPGRAALAAGLLLLVAVAVTRRYPVPGYLTTAAAAVHVLTPVAVLAGLADGTGAAGAYAAAAALGLAALGVLRAPGNPYRWLALRLPAAAVVGIAAAPLLLAVLAGPYTWLDRAWSGAPSGVGVLATGEPAAVTDPAAGAVLGLVLLTAAAGLAGRVLAGHSKPRLGRLTAGFAPLHPLAASNAKARPLDRGLRSATPAGGRRAGLAGALLPGPLALLAGLAAAGAPWPAVPAASLALGAALVLAATRRATGAVAGVGGGYGLVLAGAGLAGALPVQWSTLTALSVALVTAAAVGLAGRATGVRVAGWVGAVAAAVLLAVAATLAAGQPLPRAGFAVLAVAAAALAAARWLPAGREVATARAVEAAGNAAAVVALLLAGGDGLAMAGGIAALWGAVLAVRALRPGEPAGARTGWAAAAAGSELLAWWLLLGSRQVAAVEAYTLPAALAALAVGVWVRRSRPQLSSWTAYGPALAAAALPSLYLTLADPVPLRRLLLGAAAVAVVVAGARRSLQAPVVLGGTVAVLVGLRELGLLSQQLDTWVPLTAAGLLLVGLAATYERRRRDLARLRAALGRMA